MQEKTASQQELFAAISEGAALPKIQQYSKVGFTDKKSWVSVTLSPAFF